jgi:hypothetical protein
MTYDAKLPVRVLHVVLFLSAVAWAVILMQSNGADCCSFFRAGFSADTLQSPAAHVSLLSGWLLMLVAMMGPTLVAPNSKPC